MDWNSLLTRRDGFYEPGAFDSRSNPPRPTVLAMAASDLARTGKFHHAVLGSPGWWQRPERAFPKQRCRAARTMAKEAQKILITGATGTLGGAFARICEARGLPYQILCRQDMDVADFESVETALAPMSRAIRSAPPASTAPARPRPSGGSRSCIQARS
jgi:dTDP-4-dehydrorhamnose reductase